MRQILPCMDVHRYICTGYRAVLYHKSSAGGTYQEDDTSRGAEEQRVKHLLYREDPGSGIAPDQGLFSCNQVLICYNVGEG